MPTGSDFLMAKWKIGEFIDRLPFQAEMKSRALEMPTFSEEREAVTLEREVQDEFKQGEQFVREWMSDPVTQSRSGGFFSLPSNFNPKISLADHKGKAAAVATDEGIAWDKSLAPELTQYGGGVHETSHYTGYDREIGEYIGKKYGFFRYDADYMHEVWPRIMQSRYLLDLKPGQKVTDEDVQDLKENTRGSKTFGLFEFFGEKKVKEMLNDENIAMDFTKQLDNLSYA